MNTCTGKCLKVYGMSFPSNVRMKAWIVPKRRVLLVFEVSARLEEGPVLGTVPKGRVNPPVHIPCDCGYSRTKIIVDKDRRHLETP